MTDDELAEELEFHAKHGISAAPALQHEASERIRALSAHVALLKASLAQAEREALELARSIPADKDALPSSISRDLLGRIIDECFDGAIEDCSVIEDVYSAIVRYAKECAPQPAASAEPRDDDPTTREEYRNMFHAAVSSLAAISDALGCDPDEGGAEPIIAAIKDLKGDSSGAEPFGYFRVTPFGWEDCAETDEGAKPLYGRPAPVVSAEPVAWGWRYDSCGGAEKNKLVVREAKEAPTWLANVFPRGPFPLYTTPQLDRATLRRVVDAAWNAATESEAVPATKWADRIIDAVISDGCASQADRVAELEAEGKRLRNQVASEQYVARADVYARIDAENELREARAAVAAEREACAHICDMRAERNEEEAESVDADEDEQSNLRSAAWQISVCAAEIRARGETAAEAAHEARSAFPVDISRGMLSYIIDECFGGAIEDCSVIEDIYAAIVRYSLGEKGGDQ